MLALKLGISLPSLKSLGWSPSQDDSLVAWYQKGVGITAGAGVSPPISAWADSSVNAHDMAQATASKQPTLNSTTYTVNFDATTNDNLQSGSKISLTGDFTIGIRCFPTSFNNALIADNSAPNEFFKITTTTNFRIKIDGNTKNIGLDSGTFGDDYLVVTRSSDILSLWQNGVVQSTTPTLSGTADIDNIGVRNLDNDAYAGAIKEIQIYRSSTTALTNHVNARLSTL